MQLDALLEQLERAALQPTETEAHARHAAPRPVVGRTIVDGLLEQRDARLLPQPMAEERRRVDRHGERRCGGELHGVVHRGELGRVHPQVDLQRGVRAFVGDVVTVDVERVLAVDAHVEGLTPPQAADAGRQRAIARQVSHRRGLQVFGRERRQDAGQRDARVVRAGDGAQARQTLVELLAERGEGCPRQRDRERVALQVEAVELDREARVARVGEHAFVDRPRAARCSDHRHLELCAERRRADPEAFSRKELGERPHVLAQALREARVVVFFEMISIDVQAQARILCER